MVSFGDADLQVLCVYVAVLAVIGAIGNAMILVVYSKRKDRRPTNVFIRALAGLDLCVCIVVMPYSIVYEYHLVTSEFACKLCELTRHFNVSMSNLTLVAVAAERYVAICKPTFTVTARHVQKVLLVMVIFSVIFSIPSSFIFAVVSDHKTVSGDNIAQFNSTNSTLYAYCMFTSSILGPTATLAYQGFQMVIWFGCIVTIIVLYIFVYRVVWKRDKARNSARIRPAVWATSRANVPVGSTNQKATQMPDETRIVRVPSQGSSKGSRHDTANARTNMLTVEASQISEVSQSLELSAVTSRMPTSLILTKKTDNRINAHRKTGTMLFLCTVVYIVTWMPFWLDIFGASNSLTFRHMFFISNATNPIIYGIVNKQVRKAMVNIICRQKPNVM